jgi:hypothetical protein
MTLEIQVLICDRHKPVGGFSKHHMEKEKNVEI